MHIHGASLSIPCAHLTRALNVDPMRSLCVLHARPTRFPHAHRTRTWCAPDAHTMPFPVRSMPGASLRLLESWNPPF